MALVGRPGIKGYGIYMSQKLATDRDGRGKEGEGKNGERARDDKKPHECNESKYPCRESISWRREMARGMLSNLPALISRLKTTGKKRCNVPLLSSSLGL